MELTPDLFKDMVTGGVPGFLVVLGLVQWITQLGVKGKWATVAAMLVGLVYGAGYLVATQGLPADFGGYFTLLVYGLGLGLTTAGSYKAGKNIAGTD